MTDKQNDSFENVNVSMNPEFKLGEQNSIDLSKKNDIEMSITSNALLLPEDKNETIIADAGKQLDTIEENPLTGRGDGDTAEKPSELIGPSEVDCNDENMPYLKKQNTFKRHKDEMQVLNGAIDDLIGEFDDIGDDKDKKSEGKESRQSPDA